MQNELVCRWHSPSFQSRVKFVAQQGTDLFQPTNLVQPGDVQVSEFDVARRFFGEIEPDPRTYPTLANWRGGGGLVEHSDFAGEIALRLAQEVDRKIPKARLNPFANASALQLHDLGRTTTHSFMETDIMTDHLWRMIGIRADLHSLTHSAHLYWDECHRPLQDLTISEKISVVADTAGKRSRSNPERLRLTSEIIPAVAEGKQKYFNKPDATVYERMLIERLPEYARREIDVISHTLVWFTSLGINLDAIIQAIPVGRPH